MGHYRTRPTYSAIYRLLASCFSLASLSLYNVPIPRGYRRLCLSMIHYCIISPFLKEHNNKYKTLLSLFQIIIRLISSFVSFNLLLCCNVLYLQPLCAIKTARALPTQHGINTIIKTRRVYPHQICHQKFR